MKADYHVHYYIDACANESMTFENIENEAYKLGLEEIAVLKHYSATLPNGKQDWVCWHRIIPAEFEKYLKEKNEYKPKHLIKIYSGVETELVNERGDINIPQEAIDRIDRVALSVHYMIDLECLDMDLMLYKWAECEDTTNSSKNKPKTFSMDFTGEIQKEKLEAFLAKIEPDVFRVKGFFKVEKEGWEKVDVVGKKRDYAPYEPQPKSQLVFISKIGIALIREIKKAWDECVGLPMDLKN